MMAVSKTPERHKEEIVKQFQLSNLSPGVTEDHLTNFLEKNDAIIVNCVQKRSAGKVTVHLEQPVDVATIEDFCNKNLLMNQKLKFQALNCSGEGATSVMDSNSSSRYVKRVVLHQVPDVTEEHLNNFLESFLAEDIQSVVRGKGSKKHTVVAQFTNPIDLVKLRDDCKKSAIADQQHVTVDSANDRAALLLRNPHPSIKEDSFKFYFKNERKSGGSKDAEVKLDLHNNYLIVFFFFKDVAERVLRKSHTLEKHRLLLEPFDLDLDELPNQDTGDEKTVSSTTSLGEGDRGQRDCEDQEIVGRLQAVKLFDDKSNCSSHSVPWPSEAGDSASLHKDEDRQAACNHSSNMEKTVSGWHKACLMLVQVFLELVRDVLRVEILISDASLTIRGEEDKVSKAEEVLNIMVSKQESLPGYLQSFTSWEAVFNRVEENVSNGDYYVTLAEGLFRGDTPEELCIASSYLENFAPMPFDEFLKSLVSQREVPVTSPAARDLLLNTAWEEFVLTELEDMFDGRVEASTNDGQVVLIGDPSRLYEAQRSVRQFLANTPCTVTMQLHDKQVDYLKTCCKAVLDSLQCGTGLEYAQIEMGESGCTIKGCNLGVKKAEKEINSVCKRMSSQRVIVSHPELASFVAKCPEGWQQVLSRAADERGCLVTTLPDPRVPDATDVAENWGQLTSAPIATFSMPGSGVRCLVIEGKAELMKVDAAVELCGHDGGADPQGSQQEAHAAWTQGARPKVRPERRNDSGVEVTNPGARPCGAVLTVDPTRYFSGLPSVSLHDALTILMTDVFNVCERHHVRSLALPVFDGNQPVDKACKALVAALSLLLSAREGSGVLEVCLCSSSPACLRALVFMLEDKNFVWTLAPSPTFHLLSSHASPRGLRQLKGSELIVVKGEIAKAKAQVLVVPLDLDCDLDLSKSKLTRSLVDTGGYRVQTSLKAGNTPVWKSSPSIEDLQERLGEERLLEGEGGSLEARRVYYVYLPPWGPAARKTLTQLMEKCLRRAAKGNMKRVAVTALGVGKLGYPPEVVARTLFSVCSHFLSCSKSGVDSVQFVIFPRDHATLTAFNREHNAWTQHCQYTSAADLSPPAIAYHTLTPSPHNAGAVAYPPTSPPAHYPHQPHSQASRGSHSQGSGRHSSHVSGAWGGSAPSYASVAKGGNKRVFDKGRVVAKNPDPHHPKHQSPHNTGLLNGKCSYAIPVGVGKGKAKVYLRVKLGNIVYENCDVIVNSSNVTLDLTKGTVSRAIASQCGEQLAKECNKLMKQTKMMLKGRVLTSGKGLPYARYILHLDLAVYMDNKKDALKSALKCILDDVKPCKVIACPAIGTGESQGSAGSGGEFGDDMVSALRDMGKTKDLQEVRIVVSSSQLFHRLAAQLRRHAPPAHHQPNHSWSTNQPPAQSRSTHQPPVQSWTAPAQNWSTNQPQNYDRAGGRRESSPSSSAAPSFAPRPAVLREGYNCEADQRNSLSVFLFSHDAQQQEAASLDIGRGIEAYLGPPPPRQAPRRPQRATEVAKSSPQNPKASKGNNKQTNKNATKNNNKKN